MATQPQLAAHGIGAGQALTLDGVRDDGAELCRVLDEELRRRRRGRVPVRYDDPAWTLVETGLDPLRHRVVEALFTVGSGRCATRGAVEEPTAGSVPLTLVSGVYVRGAADEHLLPAPDWTGLQITPSVTADRHVLDLHAGVLVREESDADHPVRTLRFASVTRSGVVALRAEGGIGRVRAGTPLRPPPGARTAEGEQGRYRWVQVSGESGVTAVAAQRQRRDGDVRTVERLVAIVSGKHAPPPGKAAGTLAAVEDLGFDRLLAEHRAAWAHRWASVNVEIPGDPELELAARFALFQLWCNVGGRREAAVGARGVSGAGYAGHVFWDADVFVLPAVASMDPRLAKAMVAYRAHRLPAARLAARAAGRRGARFPWESAADGTDVTPRSGHLGGRPVEITTGRLEEHITADVAWAAWHCAEWTGDRRFARARLLPLLAESARYWASRCRVDTAGTAHIDTVTGPDEYHESVSDNAFTNVLARWNLHAAARLVPGLDAGAGREAPGWFALADALVDGYQAETGVYEQFAGYFALKPTLIADVASPPVAADVLFGQQYVAASQIIKQPDVLMLHHMVPEQVAPGSLRPNLAFYGPRTAHGSSLSPAIMAGLLARAGQPDEALPLLRTALRLDLDDLTGTTSAGLHLATMGGAWQALLSGIAGVQVRGATLRLAPNLPSSWPRLGVRFRCLGRHIRLDITPDDVRIHTDGLLRVSLNGREHLLPAGHTRLARP